MAKLTKEEREVFDTFVGYFINDLVSKSSEKFLAHLAQPMVSKVTRKIHVNQSKKLTMQ